MLRNSRHHASKHSPQRQLRNSQRQLHHCAQLLSSTRVKPCPPRGGVPSSPSKLPIGSGQVESAHRTILQKRLKIPGAWWRLERAEEMAQLRALRANNRWHELWQQEAA